MTKFSLLACLCSVIVFSSMSSCSETPKQNTEGEKKEVSSSTTDTLSEDEPAPISEDAQIGSNELMLPNGTVLNVYGNSMEALLVQFIQDPTGSLVKHPGFDLTKVTFKRGTNELADGENAQLNNIMEILKAFPKAKLAVAGHFDSSNSFGDHKVKYLKRAYAVVEALKRSGADGSRIEAKEIGDEFMKYNVAAGLEVKTNPYIAVWVVGR